MNDVELKVREILKNNTDLTMPVEEIDAAATLGEYGLNSMLYIKIVVEIESEFEIEFEDEKLDMRSLSTIKGLVEYITEKI